MAIEECAKVLCVLQNNIFSCSQAKQKNKTSNNKITGKVSLLGVSI